MLLDGFGRRIDYLRLSVTDRCNLRCVYCMPPEGIHLDPIEDILAYDELLRLVRVAVSLGVRKVRVTGGEPLVRKGVVDFIRRLSAIPGISDLCMTTNGIGLAEAAVPLRQAGLGRVNISLDTIRRDRYAEITRRDRLHDVFSGIDAAVSAGLRPVKINVVLLHGLLPGEIDDFFEMARSKPVEVRFIERMPVGCLPSGGYVSSERILERILSLPGARAAAVSAGLHPVKINVVLLHGLLSGEIDDFFGMARRKPVEVRFIERMPVGCLPSGGYVSSERIRERILSLPGARAAAAGPSASVTYEVPGFPGTVGIISPVSRKFCSDCNRLRVSADGKLRNCLFAHEPLDLRAALRGGMDDLAVAELFLRAVAAKPEGHDLCGGSSAPESMSRIGG